MKNRERYIRPRTEVIADCLDESILINKSPKGQGLEPAKKNNLSSDEEDIGSQYGFSPVGGSEDLWDD